MEAQGQEKVTCISARPQEEPELIYQKDKRTQPRFVVFQLDQEKPRQTIFGVNKKVNRLKKKTVLNFVFREINAVLFLLYRKCVFFEDWY